MHNYKKSVFLIAIIFSVIYSAELTEEVSLEPINTGYTLFVNLPKATDLSENKTVEIVLIFSTKDEPTSESEVCTGGRQLSMGYMLAQPADNENSSLTPIQSFKWRANYCPGESSFLKSYISNITFSKADNKVFFGDFTLKENVFMGTEEAGTFFDASMSQTRFFKLDTFNDKTLASLEKLVVYFNFVASKNDKPKDYAESFDESISKSSTIIPDSPELPELKNIISITKSNQKLIKTKELNELIKASKLAYGEENSQDDECTCKCSCNCGDDDDEESKSENDTKESREEDTNNCVNGDNNKDNPNPNGEESKEINI